MVHESAHSQIRISPPEALHEDVRHIVVSSSINVLLNLVVDVFENVVGVLSELSTSSG